MTSGKKVWMLALVLLAPLGAAWGPDGEAEGTARDDWADFARRWNAAFGEVPLETTLADGGLPEEARWAPWVALRQESAAGMPEAIARLQGLDLPPGRCSGAPPSLEAAVEALGLALGEDLRLADDAGLEGEDRDALSRLVACVAGHAARLRETAPAPDPDAPDVAALWPAGLPVSPIPAMPPGGRPLDAQARTAALAAWRDVLALVQAMPPLGAHLQAITCVDSACRIQLGGPGPDTYAINAVLIVDSGGMDTYLNNAAGANTFSLTPLSVLVDQGIDDDLYAPVSTDGQTTPTIAAGMWGGLGILRDEGGDDHYVCRGACMGAGLIGSGVLVDEGGNDFYESFAPTPPEVLPGESHKVVLGAVAYAGYGVLVDEAGDDVYVQHGVDSLGYGAAGALGILLDRDGNDHYLTFPAFNTCAGTPCAAPFFSGVSEGVGEVAGIGLLLDEAGNDEYRCDAPTLWACMGNAHFGGNLGILRDEGGNDMHNLGARAVVINTIPGGLGSAATDGLGILLNVEGNDSYTSGAALSGGYGFGGVGLFTDLSGSDSYTFTFAPALVVPSGTVRADNKAWIGECGLGTWPACVGNTGFGFDG